MKKIKFLLLGIVSIFSIGLSFGYTSNGITYVDGIYHDPINGYITVLYGDQALTIYDRVVGQDSTFVATGGNRQNAPFYLWGNFYTGISIRSHYNKFPSDFNFSLYGPTNFLNTGLVFGYNNNPFIDSITNLLGNGAIVQGPCYDGYHLPRAFEGSQFYDMVCGLTGFQNTIVMTNFALSSTRNGLTNTNGYFNTEATTRVFWVSDIPFGYVSNYCWRGQGSGIQNTTVGSATSSYRCFKDSLVLPTNSWETIYLGSVEGLPDDSGGGDSGQDFESPVDGGIFDFNTFLIEKSILCYMSSGTFGGSYGNCDGLNYTGFVDQYEHVSPIWSGDSESGFVGNIVFNNAQSVLSNYCVNTDLIQYQFCSQLDVYSGAYLMYYYEDGLLSYYVLGDGFGVDLGNLGSGQLGNLTCQGAWCNNISQGLPEYIIPSNTGENNFGLSGDIISEDFYNDFIDKGFWFRCPYSYSGSYFVLGKDLINRLGGRDILVPINCFISAFSMGSKMLLFGDPQYGNYWSGSLISGDTPGHQRLFLFFDLILSIGIIVVLFKLYNLFTSKK